MLRGATRPPLKSLLLRLMNRAYRDPIIVPVTIWLFCRLRWYAGSANESLTSIARACLSVRVSLSGRTPYRRWPERTWRKSAPAKFVLSLMETRTGTQRR